MAGMCAAAVEFIQSPLLVDYNTVIFIVSQTPVQGYCHPCPCDGFHLDHWTVCSGGGGEGLCLPLCHCQCVSGE